MKQERDLKEREEKLLAQQARDTQVQLDSGLLNAITAVGAVLTLCKAFRGGNPKLLPFLQNPFSLFSQTLVTSFSNSQNL